MAERKRAASRSAPPPDLVAAAFELIAERGWAGLNMADLAARAGLPLVEVYRGLPSAGALLAELGRRADEAMLAGGDDEELAGLPPRDRAFELIMRRFEALERFKPGLRALARERPADPVVWLGALRNLDRATAWLGDAAGLTQGGLRGAIARRALGLAYLRTVRVWLGDESVDLATTMAELDKNLRRIEGVAGLGAGPRRAAEEAPPGDAAAAL